MFQMSASLKSMVLISLLCIVSVSSQADLVVDGDELQSMSIR